MLNMFILKAKITVFMSVNITKHFLSVKAALSIYINA